MLSIFTSTAFDRSIRPRHVHSNEIDSAEKLQVPMLLQRSKNQENWLPGCFLKCMYTFWRHASFGAMTAIGARLSPVIAMMQQQRDPVEG